MFNNRAEFDVPVLSGGIIRAVLRFPTDDQWIERQRSIRVVERRHQKRKAEGALQASAVLFDAIAVDPEAVKDWDGEEKSAAIDFLEKCQVTGVERDGDAFVFTIAVAGGEVTHTLAIPRMKAMRKYGNNYSDTDDSNPNAIVTRRALEPARELWLSVKQAVSGYAEGSEVPICHMDAVIGELLLACGDLMRSPDPE